jgi:hypothetical protein
MNDKKPEENQPIKALPGRVQQLRNELKNADPHLLTERTMSKFHSTSSEDKRVSGDFSLTFWGQDITISYPDFIARSAGSSQELGLDAQAILLFHFRTSRGTSLVGRWIAFSELPDGRFYSSAFQGYTGAALVQAFEGKKEAFEYASLNLGGIPADIGDSAYIFNPLPRIPLLAIYWEGDEDFPASIQILFDASIIHHLPTDVCAILGSMLTRRLIKAGQPE